MFLFLEHKITMASGLLVKVVGLADACRKEVEVNKELKDELKDELKEENEKLKRRVEVLEMRSGSVSESEGPANIKKKKNWKIWRISLSSTHSSTQYLISIVLVVRNQSQQYSVSDLNGTPSQKPDDEEDQGCQILTSLHCHFDRKPQPLSDLSQPPNFSLRPLSRPKLGLKYP